ncbi:LOW QUALITY PROTEIN: hypothetical protein Cgig2_009237 [Carnegiea gigantea]|uniref:Uncharacterized protein n=1 Tax=Carnegiea gigantea TaxID=171969 RepID=A0A9Q1GJE2_9CARY|nr:LOW QUALITY PROTEIN: hypothetical protein Cgig2_009237 [Carnegiea gigantea]
MLWDRKAAAHEAWFPCPQLERPTLWPCYRAARPFWGLATFEIGTKCDVVWAEWYHGSGTTSGSVLSFAPTASLYNGGVRIFVKSHLSALANLFIERKRTSFLERERESLSFFIMETFKWHVRGTERPPESLPENYNDLCLYFDLSMAEEATQDFRIPEMTQVVFYAIVVSEDLELGIVNRDLAEHLKSSLEDLRWYMCEAWL